MKTHKFTAAALLAAAALGTAAFAQPAAVTNPTPAVATPNEVVYVPQLPSAA